MTFEEFEEKIGKAKRVGNDTEIKIHTESGDYDVSSLEYSKNDNTLRVCTMDEAKTVVYRCTYRITKDHRVHDVVTTRITLREDEDPVLDMADLIERFKKENGFDKYETSDKTGSTVVPSTEMVPVVQADGETVKMEEKEVKHYFNLEMLEIFKVVDDDNDIYVRVWKDGSIG